MKRLVHKLLRALVPPAYRGQSSRTVRYAFPAVAFLTVFLSVAAVTVSQKSTIELIVSDATVSAGRTFSVDVYVTAEVPVNAVDIEVAVPSSVKVTGIDTGESVITLWTNEPYVEKGVVYLRGGTFRRGFSGRHLIATINGVSESPGVVTVKVQKTILLAGDGTGATVPYVAGEAATLYVINTDGSYDSSGVGTDAATATIVITDIDGDGDVSLADVSRFMVAWTSRSFIYDFDNDGKMTFRDFGIILSDTFFK